MRLHARSTVGITLAGALLVPSSAFAQLPTTMTTTTGPSVTRGQQTAPERYVNGHDMGTQTRSNGLNPTGINYSDCISDMTLGFPVVMSGFGVGNADGMQVWASVSGMCTDDADRGNGGVPTCWLVSEGLPLGGTVPAGSAWYYVRVQDIVGWQQAPPNPPVLQHAGASACTAQPSFAAVTITLWFVPLSTEGTSDPNATAFEWPLITDLVGPQAPAGLTVGAGETLLVANWTANADSDTYGYDIFIDPPPGSLAQQMVTTKVICPSSTSSAADASEDAAPSDATMAADASDASSLVSSSSSGAADAECVQVNIAPIPPSVGVCSSTVLGGAVVVDSGIAPVEDDAGLDAALLEAEEADAGTSTGVGGIATIPCQYALSPSGSGSIGCSSGSPIYTETSQTTVTGETVTTFNIKGLTDDVTYAVAVSAVDNSGNPGPPSTVMCNYPASVCDFYCAYQDAGGLAGGGFCALQGGTKLDASSNSPVGTWIALGTAGVAVVAVGRRRRKPRAAPVDRDQKL